LVIDVGGTHVKVRVTGRREERKIDSGPTMTAAKMVSDVKGIVNDWAYDAVSIGYPGPVIHGRPMQEPHNLGGGWVGFDFRKAFGRPIQMINDAAMQALGSYEGGRMLFLGLGTGLGSAMIVDGILEPMELAHLPYKNGRTYEDYIGGLGWRKFQEAQEASSGRTARRQPQRVRGGCPALEKTLGASVLLTKIVAQPLRLPRRHSCRRFVDLLKTGPT
jgi:polyphosphate glucokinase